MDWSYKKTTPHYNIINNKLVLVTSDGYVNVLWEDKGEQDENII